jgi:2-enoate reductase
VKLFSPGKIGKMVLRNRLVMAPMSIIGLIEPDGRISQRIIDYYVERARGGVGLIVTCPFRVHRWLEQPPDLPYVRHPMLDNKIYVTRLNELAEAVHDHGAKIAVMLTAGHGRVAGREYLREGRVAAPSPLPCFWDPSAKTLEITIEEIGRLLKGFEFSSEILRSADMDAVELHGHEGYLFDQFKTGLWNKRRDTFGGNLKGRLNFTKEVIQAIKRGAGEDFPIIYRFGLTHYLNGGREISEGLEIARELESFGVHALDVDAGCYETWHWAHPPTTQPPGCMVNMADYAKKVVHIPVMAVGKLGYPDLAEKVLEEEKADFIVLGRALLADPDWPNKVMNGKVENIRPCIGDHECLKRVFEHKYISCAVNPRVGMEREFLLSPAQKVKTVLVIGGGPSGMQASITAAARGHRVTLWEKARKLGGNLIPASTPDFKKDYRNLLNYLSNEVQRLGITVEVGKEASPAEIHKLNSDVVFIATGSLPIIPEIPGINNSHVSTAIDALLGKAEIEGSVIIIGGGITGCETALHLLKMGKTVTVVELLDSIMRDTFLANKMHLLELLKGANILTDTKVLEIGDKAVTVVNKDGHKQTLEASSVLIASGLRPDRTLLDSLDGTISEVYPIGDCVQPRKIINAIWEAYRIGRLI